uniref:Uncharacterized protein n=1 Tax=Timema poppense TaxID=170557 RepID=A0A7R9H2J0_TIMPO|nr:unnamed protein product [Timema poppensis]
MEAIKNNYLNHIIKDINPRILNRMVNKVINRETKYYDLEPPILKLHSTIPNIYGPHVDVTRAKVAFGRWALPKLRRELHDEDPLVVNQAINSLADLIHDPEKSFEAIRLHFVPRLVDLMVHKDAFLRKRCAEIMTTLASQAVGREAILKNATVITNMGITVHDDQPEIRLKASQAVEMIARTYQGTVILNNANFVPLLASKMMHEIDDIVVSIRYHLLLFFNFYSRTLFKKNEESIQPYGTNTATVSPSTLTTPVDISTPTRICGTRDVSSFYEVERGILIFLELFQSILEHLLTIENVVGEVMYQASMRFKESILEHLLTIENVVGEVMYQASMRLEELMIFEHLLTTEYVVGEVMYQASMRLKELRILEHLLTIENVVGEAIDQGTMGLMEVLMNRQRPDVVARAISCLQLLLMHPSGKKIAVTTNLTHGLKRTLFSEDREVHTMATAALMFITITTMGKKEALNINIMDRLLELASDFNCKELQINCVKGSFLWFDLQTLTNMAEAPEGRKKLLENYIPAIEAIRTLKNQDLERHISTLLDTVRWKP